MSARIFSLVLVVDRFDEVRLTIDGRRVGIASTTDPAAALVQLATRLDGAAWTAGRSTLEELGDERSPIYEAR